jgi:ABC-2 type transport system permease protein
MSAFFALVRKDLLLYLNNRRALLMSLVAPILIAAFFGSLFGGKENKPAHIPIAVTDLDRSELSAQIVAALRADASVDLRELDEATALAQVRAGQLRAAVTLPAGFGRQAPGSMFGGASKPELLLVYDPSQTMVLPMVRGLLAQHVMQRVSQAAFSSGGPVMRDAREQVQHNAQLGDTERGELMAMFDSIARVQARSAAAASSAAPASSARPAMNLPFTTREIEAVDRSAGPAAGYNSYAHSFAGMGVQFILLLGVDMGIGLLTMRRQGLWKRLRAAPLSRPQLLGSRIASTALIALGVFGVLFGVAITFFGVRIAGSVPGFVAVLAAFALLTASFGLMIAALGRTPEATRGLAILATLLLVMLGGAWVPSFIFPPWLQTLSAWVPTHWAIEGLDGMTWRAQPLSAALLPTGLLLAFAAVFAVVAMLRFDWEE